MSSLKAALKAAGISITGYDPSKSRSVRTHNGSTTVGKFSKDLSETLKKKLINYPEVFNATIDLAEMAKLLEEYAEEELDPETGVSIPQDVAHLTLNIDMSSTDQSQKKFFCTTTDEFRDPSTSGQYYLGRCGISPLEAYHHARSVVPKYMPRSSPGIHEETNPVTQLKIKNFNNYVPPMWELWKRRNPTEWNKLPTKIPKDILRMIKHVIPDQVERNYLYAWLYSSLTRRSLVYLVLCGNPGVGKNRLKLLMRALHGAQNASDGKKETLGANQSKFNSQMEENTFLWFDELKYGPDMEPRMKEYQNPYISIEKKGQDSTRSTEIFCSMVISNNHARDNYILFNSRKFAPLQLGKDQLDKAMTPAEIEDLSARMDDTDRRFDVKLIAQVAKWLMDIGPKHLAKWPSLEYQGPMFWELAHSSLPRWQKIAAKALSTFNKNGPFPGWDPTVGGFLWSAVEEALRRKKEYEAKDYRDPSTVKAFFSTYRGTQGEKVFEVKKVSSGTMQDFWIIPINGLEAVKGRVSLETSETKEYKPVGMSEFQWKKMQALESKLKGSNKDG